MIHQDLKNDLKTALKEKKATKLSVVRGLLAAFTNEAITLGKKPDEWLSDDEALSVIKRASKQRQDSIAQFTSGGRPELAEIEKAELAILETYLPEAMSETDIKKIAQAKITELHFNDKSKSGILIGAIMKATNGQADGNLVKKIVDELLITS